MSQSRSPSSSRRSREVAPYYLHGGKEFIYTYIRHNDAYGIVMRGVQKHTVRVHR